MGGISTGGGRCQPDDHFCVVVLVVQWVVAFSAAIIIIISVPCSVVDHCCLPALQVIF